MINLKNIKKAASLLANAEKSQIDLFLDCLSKILESNRETIINANKKDIKNAIKLNLPRPVIDRLVLDNRCLKKIICRIKEIKRLESPIGKVYESKILEKGMLLKKVAVPIGVIFVIYESRPEVTIDVAGLCIKSGNAAILKGGSEALNTNCVLFDCIQQALDESGITKDAILFINSRLRIVTKQLLQASDFIDLVIARGGYGMVKKIIDISKIPVLAHSSGGARIYVDESADLDIAEKIIINSKISKPAACNSLDTILVHNNIAKKFIPQISGKLKKYGVLIKSDYDKEFLGLFISVKVVESLDVAINFIQVYGRGHSEGIIAKDKKRIEKFVNSIDSAAVFVNCSTRFHDGFEFGLGAEMGIATGKIHARGPVGLNELTTYKWVMYGNGQVRE